jgi:hypothetical protein
MICVAVSVRGVVAGFWRFRCNTLLRVELHLRDEQRDDLSEVAIIGMPEIALLQWVTTGV